MTKSTTISCSAALLKFLSIIFLTNLFLFNFFLTNHLLAQINNTTFTNSGPIEGTIEGDNNNIITNTVSGTITVESSAAYGIQGGDFNTATNLGTITVTATNSAYGIFGDDNNIITNSGDILAAVSGNSTSANGIYVYDNNIITNSRDILAIATEVSDSSGASVNAYSIYVNDNNKIINSGIIEAATAAETTVAGESSSDNAYANTYGIFGQNNNTITNSGTITVTAVAREVASDAYAEAYGIYVNDNNTITNSGTITAEAVAIGDVSYADAYGIYGYNSNTITNSGTITVTAIAIEGVGSSDSYTYGIYGYNSNTITNSGTITVTDIVSTDGAARGIYLVGLNNKITNSGTIETITTNLKSTGILIYNSDNNIINNSGFIIATSESGAARGIVSDIGGEEASAEENQITNTGTITVSSETGLSTGILSLSNNDTINNIGVITATSADGAARGIVSTGDGNIVTNTGTITVSSSDTGLSTGILSWFNDNNIINNTGVITATSGSGNARGIVSIGDNIISNSGKITADTAILSIGGNLNILPNSYIDGTISLTGATVVNITTGPSHSIYYNLGVTPTFSGPTPGFTDGTIAATFDPTVFKGSINELADLNNNISLTASKNLSNFKDRQFSTSVFASQLEHKADAVNLKQEIDQLGVVFGYDYKLADTNLNFIAGYANSDLEANSRFAKSYNNKSKGPFIGVAGIYDAGLVNVNFGLTTGLLKHSHDRFVNDNEETNGEAHAKANYDSMFIAPEIGVSKKIKSNGITFSPKANVRYNYQSVDGYTETGSNSNATVKSLDVGLVETNLEVAGTKSLNKSSYTIKTGYLNRQSVGDHKATVTMIGQTNSIGFGDKSNNIYYAGVGTDLDLSIFKLSLDLNQYLGDAEGFQGMIKLSSSF